jgi:ATP-dependent DNA helicase RecG
MKLDAPIQAIKGVGAALTEKLNALGVETVQDMLYFFPRRYEDFSHITKIADIAPGKVTIKATVESVVGRYVRRRMHITEAILADGSAKTRAVWFNQPYRAAQLKNGEKYYFSGTYDFQRNRYILSNPATELAQTFGVSTARIVPVYPETKGLKSQQIRKVLRELLPLITMLPESLPTELVAKEGLLPLSDSLKNLHFPEDGESLDRAKQRIAFEELLQMLTASLLSKQENSKLKGWQIPFNQVAAKHFTDRLTFTLTDAQKRAAWEILQDFEKPQPMNRLLQGDVGSGKTVVAAMAAFMAARSGFQTAFMAPTEILATQHAATLSGLLEPMGVKVGLLVGSVKAKAKAELKQRIAGGEVVVAVGTHALITKDNDFHKLGLVVVDEQHRFGVRQRSELLGKSEHMPHMLSMTATPIPRSLQLTVYGELDVSILNELPKGRLPIETKIVTPTARYTAYEKIDAEIKSGRQAYVVCPVISDGVNAELKSVEAEHERLNKSVFRHRRLGLLHGQLKADEKEAVMQRFKRGALDILICTTVVEVGVDVPNATCMLIEGADRFGLAQLHQLRGRVGRSQHQSYCYLVPSTAQAVSKRLRELEQSNDGFHLAEVDLELRGPGEIYGRAQHGKLELNFVNMADTTFTKRVQESAEWLVGSNLLSGHARLSEGINKYRRLTVLN